MEFTKNRIAVSIALLHIGWSIVFGFLLLGILVFWARSYWYLDWCQLPCSSKSILYVRSLGGGLDWVDVPAARPWDLLNPNAGRSWCGSIRSSNLSPLNQHDVVMGSGSNMTVIQVVAPLRRIQHWCVAILLSAVAAIPWLPRRFSLRGLFIFTALISLLLGLMLCFAQT
jgi:hypothetical protein